MNTYDPVGNITSLQTESEQSTYKYDDLYQLAEENGHFSHTYAYDSHYNRLRKDGEIYSLNDLGQLTTKQYDPNGNLHYSGSTTYNYDALDRLISIESPQQRLTFTYDSFHSGNNLGICLMKLRGEFGGTGVVNRPLHNHGLLEKFYTGDKSTPLQAAVVSSSLTVNQCRLAGCANSVFDGHPFCGRSHAQTYYNLYGKYDLDMQGTWGFLVPS